MAEESKRERYGSGERYGAGETYGAGERYGSGESYGSGERYGAGAGAPHGTAQTPASNGRTGRESPVNARHGGGSSVGGR